MFKSKTAKNALLIAAVALMLCVSMFVGTTFAWFTDQETSANNRIVAGNLDVDLLMYNGTSYVSIANANGDIFNTGATANNSNATLWEPGKTQVAYLRIENKGNLDLKYQVSLKVDNVAHDLYEVMEYAIVPNAASGTGVSQWNGGNKVVVGTQLVATETTLAAGTYHDFALAIHMLEEAGNEYKNGEVSFDITVEATQLASEFDSFGNDYDVDSPFITKTTLNIPTDKITNGAITEDMMIGSETGNAYAELTVGTKLADGATALTLSTSKADANTGDDLYAGEVYGFDFSIDGLAGDNTEPVTVTKKAALPTGLTNVVGYHKGALFTDFTYDPATGDVTVTVATFCNFTFATGDKIETVTDFEALVNAGLDKGAYVALKNDITNAPVATTAPYGNKYGIAQNGGVLDGNGNALIFNSKSGDNYGIMTSGGTIKNLSVGGVFRGIVIMDPKETVYIDNVVIDDANVCYSINTAEGDGKQEIIITNSKISGWNSYGNTIKSVSFTKCEFAQGTYYNNVYGRLVRPYVTATFKDCDFSSMYYIDLSALVEGETITFENCTVKGVKLTADNWTELVAPESTCGENQISIEGRDGSYMTAENVFNYVIIK